MCKNQPFFQVQNNNPVRNDWVLTVKQDLVLVKIEFSFEEIKEMTKNRFSALVKEKVRAAALEELLIEKSKLSKMDRLNYKNLEMQKYLKSKNIYPDVAKNIYKFRTFMGEAKRNFKTQYLNDLKCSQPQCEEEETQEHLLCISKIFVSFHENLPE